MNKHGKHIDKTFLSIDQAEARGFIHRDYIGHCFRWSHVIKQISKGQAYKTARILDIGCGKLVPMATLLHSNRMAPEYYCGVEYGPVDTENPSVRTTVTSPRFVNDIWDHTDIRNFSLDEGEEKFNTVVCFEMLEHIEPSMVHETLKKMREVCTPDARIFISTPVFNGKAAANHVNEMTMEALAAVFIDHMFAIKAMHGVFASITDYYADLTAAEREVFEDLRAYYDVNVLATIFAPLHPAGSRNILWELSPTGKSSTALPSFVTDLTTGTKDWDDIEMPWSSSEQMEDLRREQ